MRYDAVIVGAGYCGAVTARCLADYGKQVLVLEKRDHISGNAYDYLDENQVLRHEYGPHIFHTDSKQAVDFLSRFTDWFPYEHRVLGYLEGKLVPIPFNLTSIEMLFQREKADHLKQVLIDAYGMDQKVPILELRKNEDPEIRELADYIFEHVFKYYTMKQWGYTAEEIDPAVTGRVPVLVSYDDRYFRNRYQQMPKKGYTAMFQRMLNHPGIHLELGTDSSSRLQVDPAQKKVFLDGQEYPGTVVYTGLVDDLLGCQLGELSYRSLEFEIETEDGDYQPVTTVNYPTPAKQHPYTRISEYKKMMLHPPVEKTTIAIEYPYAYDRHGKKGNVPYYPVFTEASRQRYQDYVSLLDGIQNLHLLGRLAEYRYYDMDAAVDAALELSRKLLAEG